MKSLSSYLDNHGFVFHYDDYGIPEFGDGTSRLGLEWFPWLTKIDAQLLKQKFLTNYCAAFEGFKEPVRYPYDSTKWYGQFGFMSRDNSIPPLCCLALTGESHLLWSFFKKIIKRGGFLWNTKKIGQQDESWKMPDWCGLGVIAVIVRGFINSHSGLSFLLYLTLNLPFLLVADLFLLLSSVWRLLSLYIDADNCGDCLNLICLLAVAKETKTETPFSFAARMLYSGLHPGAGPNNQSRMIGYGPLTSFQHYFAGDRNPPIDEIWKPYLLERF